MATGVVRLSDVIVPPIFSPIVQLMTEEKSRLIRSGSPQSCHPHERYLLRSTDWDALPDALRQEPAPQC